MAKVLMQEKGWLPVRPPCPAQGGHSEPFGWWKRRPQGSGRGISQGAQGSTVKHAAQAPARGAGTTPASWASLQEA